jgi:hypothetical protein
VRHAGGDALAQLSELLQELRNRKELVERRPGIFYVKGKAFLHFHEDRAGLFADFRQHRDWLRLPVNDPGDQAKLLAAIDQTLEPRSDRS